MKKLIATFLSAALFVPLCCACGATAQPAPTDSTPASAAQTVPALDTSDPVTLTICGPWSASKAVENAAAAFTAQYPNCEIQYECLQNYVESIDTRLSSAPDSVDVFVHTNMQEGDATLPYAEDLFAHPELNLSATNPALIKNYTFKNADTSAAPQIYSIPLGGELRGMYVNKTLLASVGQEVPTNVQELLDACEALKQAGYVAMNGNPGMFAQRLLYPYVCNLIANADDYQATYDKVNSCEAGVSELFRAPMQLMYTMVENGYYNYKFIETEYNMYTDNSDEGFARDFFNIKDTGSGLAKVDDVGMVAFTSGTLTQLTTMDKIREDYHSEIEYAFVLAPVSEDGGFGYISPSNGIAVNKSSPHLDWSIAFLNYLFSEKGNLQFANDSHYIPNTADSFGFVSETFNVPENHVSDLGQCTFDYDFYGIINDALITTSKSNNPKYMEPQADGSTKMYAFDYYMEQLEAAFAAQRESGGV